MKRQSLVVAVLALWSGCLVPQEQASNQKAEACTKCHGDETRAGTALERAAPPFDTRGNTESQFPSVGAHAQHLSPGPTHAAVACSECHVVPTTSADDEHNTGRTEIVFGAMATRDGGLAPSYDSATQRCSNSGCHGPVSGVWSRPRAQGEQCGVCHGLPPAPPHPQAGACFVCHSTVDADGGFVLAKQHLNGFIDVAPAACDSCHGQGEFGAPPRALDGGVARSHVGVGAHQAHLDGGTTTAPVACQSCHVVPGSYVTPSHPNGGRAEVKLIGADVWNSQSQTCTSQCHGGISPNWATDVELSCTSCHGAPPPEPHPQVSNCSLCHPNATGFKGREVKDKTQHVNGQVEVSVSASCDACHGDAVSPAPPRDAQGRTDTALTSVGAHRSHVIGRGLARTVRCQDCHKVPSQTVSAGHLNGVAEVVFSGVAKANGAQPVYTGVTCANSACHDIAHFTAAPGGGNATTPIWTVVDGTQVSCTSCHGMPPPAPHPARDDCGACHHNVTTLRLFVNPERHVDGRVDF